MPNRYYSAHSEQKITAPAKGAPTGAKGPRMDGVKVGTAAWGLKGLPTQTHDRSHGVYECPQYAKWEGMSKGGAKVAKVMHEYKEGMLHSGSKKGPMVTSRKQAVAIAMSEAGMSKKKHK